MANENYNVVFEYTRECGGYEGVRTWTSFRDKKHFEEWYTDEIKRREKVLAEGVTAEKAVEIAQRTPLVCRLTAAVQEAADPKTGKVDQSILEMELTNVAFSRLK